MEQPPFMRIATEAQPTAYRRRLPDRRAALTVEIEWEGQKFAVTPGFDAEGALGEIFVEGPKVGTAMWRMLQDDCVMLSLLLQFGIAPDYLLDRLARNGASHDAAPSGVLGLALKAAIDQQRAHGAALALVSRMRGKGTTTTLNPDGGAR